MSKKILEILLLILFFSSLAILLISLIPTIFYGASWELFSLSMLGVLGMVISTNIIYSSKILFKKEDNGEITDARRLGITRSELQIFKYFARHKNRKPCTIRFIRFTDIHHGSGLSKPTAKDALNSMLDHGFIRQDTKKSGLYGLTPTGFKFIEEEMKI